jgi:hypothetical protein
MKVAAYTFTLGACDGQRLRCISTALLNSTAWLAPPPPAYPNEPAVPLELHQDQCQEGSPRQGSGRPWRGR